MEKTPKKSINRTKEEIENFLANGLSNIQQQSAFLNAFTQRNKNTTHINHKVYHLLTHPFIYMNASSKLAKNTGALTKGVPEDEEDMQFFGLQKAQIIANKIKKYQYQPKPARRVMIPKPGKTTMRPLDTPTQEDRIVQEAIRGILEAVFEPEFILHDQQTRGLASNFGFRPNKSCLHAVDGFKWYAQNSSFVIEGDVIGAYNHVPHNKLLKDIASRIPDKKFLELIDKFLKAGYLLDKTYNHTLTGTPQGSIISPILFNIYMHKLDMWMYNTYIFPVLEQDSKLKLQKSKTYQNLGYKKRTLQNLITSLKRQKNFSTEESEKTTKTQQIKSLKLSLLNVKRQHSSTVSSKLETIKRSFFYVRYADDWVLTLTGTKELAVKIKQEITEYFRTELEMELDGTKTNITQIKKRFNFLGFNIGRAPNNVYKHVLQKVRNTYTRTKTRTSNRKISIIPHQRRVLDRLKLLKIFKIKSNRKYQGIGSNAWSQLDEFQIVTKYSSMLSGICNYYRNCDNTKFLNLVSYLLYYACAKTIAIRRKITMPQVFTLYGKTLKISAPYADTNRERITQFLDLKTLRAMGRLEPLNLKNLTKEPLDPFRIKTFWRTTFKMYEHCFLCGDITPQMHHFNSLQKLKINKSAALSPDSIRSQLNRKQAPLCHRCHVSVTNGTYNKENLRKAYDIYLGKL